MNLSSKPIPRAFTLIELVVVMIVMSIIMAITLPRLSNSDGRKLQNAADELADMLTMFAHHAATEHRPIAIWHDYDRNWIVLLVMDIDPATPNDPPQWQIDRFVQPIKLPDSVDRTTVFGMQDGEAVDFQRWPIATRPGQPRTEIQISFTDDTGRTKTLLLKGHSLTPVQLDNAAETSAIRLAIDLDATGRRQEDW
ncbi:MAG: prepilin-type N-terminal cleavage/methylation domain-containing protein [Planctomycetes bacterium]|nr:prepilin-type N-terminal cleavage/methylation domain-containing protein [Planctomycetota bacterium]